MESVNRKSLMFDKRLEVMLPESFQTMEKDSVELMYPYEDNPQLLLEDPDASRFCTFSLLKDQRLAGSQVEFVIRSVMEIYYLRPLSGMQIIRRFNDHQSGCSFQADVRAVKQDRVQITLLGDGNSGQEITRWFPYSTGNSSLEGPGWYCMPETGDRVRLQIPDPMEEHGYVISAVHKETGSDRKNPEHKSFKTKYGKELLFTPDSLELTNNKGMSVKIADGAGIEIVSNKNISIIAKGNMTLSSEISSLILAGTKSVDIKQGGAGLHLEQDVTFTGGKFRIQ